MVRADGPKSVRVISVIEVKAKRGLGKRSRPAITFRSGYMGVKALAEYY